MDETGIAVDKFAAINDRIGDRIVIDPAAVGGNDSGNDGEADSGSSGNDSTRFNKDGSIRKKRGRKAGTKSTSSASSKNSSSVKGIEKILYSIHFMAAGFLKTPELALDEQEAKLLAEAANSVQEFYNFETSAEVLLWTNVIGVLGAVYVPRIISMVSKPKKVAKPTEASEKPITPIEGVFTPHHAPSE